MARRRLETDPEGMAGYHTPFAAHSGAAPEALARPPEERPRLPAPAHGGGRPPLPPGGARGASTRLSSLALDESFDSLLPLSPSLDNFLAAAGAARVDSRAPSQQLPGPGRLFSVSVGRLSKLASMNSFDLNWLLSGGGAAASLEGPDALTGMQLDGASGTAPAARASPVSDPSPGQQQRRSGEGPAPARQPSLAELIVGSPAVSPQLPPAPPLLLRSTPADPQLGPPRAPVSVGGAKRAAVVDASGDSAQRAERRLQLQACSDAAAAGSPPWEAPAAVKEEPEGLRLPLPATTAAPAAGMSSAEHRDAAAAHAAQAAALQQEMYLQSVMMGCSTNDGGSCAAAGARQLAAQLAPQPCGSQGWPGIGAAPAVPQSQLAEAALLQRAGFGSAFAADPALSQLYGFPGGRLPPALPVGLPGGLQAQLQALPAQCGTGSMSTQDKMAVWAQQNALMAAITASPCPEMAAATFQTGWTAASGGYGLAGVPFGSNPFGQPQPAQSAYFHAQTPSMQVRISTPPTLRVATVPHLRVAPTPSGSGGDAGGGGAASTGDSP